MVKLLKCTPAPLPFHSNNLLFLSAQFYSVQETFFTPSVPAFDCRAPLLRKRLLWTLSLSSTITDETIIVRHCWDRSCWQMANFRWIRQIKSLSFGSIWAPACVFHPVSMVETRMITQQKYFAGISSHVVPPYSHWVKRHIDIFETSPDYFVTYLDFCFFFFYVTSLQYVVT